MADVKEFPDERYAILKTPKNRTEYRLHKDISGHRFFEFKTSNGPLPEELKGKFSSLKKGIEAFEQFERNLKESRAKRRDDWQEEKEAKRAKLQSERS